MNRKKEYKLETEDFPRKWDMKTGKTVNLNNVLDIRYTKLHISLLFINDAEVPPHKASALRGGMGEMMLQANCIRDRKCESCNFESECIVQRIMYSRFDKKPDFVTTGESIAYIVTCRDYRNYVHAGDIISFELILFGKNIVYFNQYLQALYALGQNGLGSAQAFFEVHSVMNLKGEPLLENGNLYMERYRKETVREYVEYRLRQLKPKRNNTYTIRLQTPLTVKYQGKFLTELHADALMRAVQRRIYMLDCFEDIDGEELYYKEFPKPEITEQNTYLYSINRMSFRKNKKIVLKGLRGTAVVSQLCDEIFILLLAGELVHIGKNTSFGFGKYKIEKCVDSYLRSGL